ncbi:MAG: two-component regulator propeller domain-containing protein [Romboutsia timonensis]|uniref:ligand-binding sensor domain-containing protein n=1 Tax=Romboutsia timonensis TaxID=1776391 RepID=UPI002A74CF4B|nr:two-component regulator propeller domain-containing protein [Romboutsia timonensis]MDY3000837.1 two-component regulator propeller domain-containing protein [Romboutsia timonensis]
MRVNKKINIILILVCIFSCLKISTSYANIRESFNFKNITIEDGLSQSTVETIYQDSKGYIWIGTNDGLDRYNGYEFKHYKHDKYDKNSIANNYIVDIIEDKNGYIWVSTIGGLSRINPDKDEIKNYYSKEDSGNLSNSNLWQLLCTKDNRLIASTIDGLNVYDKNKDKFTRILYKEGELPSQYIYSLEEDINGHIWVGTDNGLVELDKDLNIVKSYQDAIGDSDVYNVYDDSKGNIWVCTLDNGLFKINLDDKSVENYKNNNSKRSIPSNNVRDIISDSEGKLWIATDKGICTFDYEREEFITYNKKLYQSNSLIDDEIFCLLKDSSGLIWIGTYSGISRFNPNSNFTHFKLDPYEDNSISGNVIHGIYEDDDKTLWIGTNESGVNIINGESIRHLNKENSNLISDLIEDITGFKNYIFIGTNEGLSVLVKNDKTAKNYTITNYTTKDGLPSNKIRSLFIDSKGYLWIGTNKGLAILDTNNNKIIDITYILDEMGVSDKFIRAVYEDSKGNYYIGCFLEGGLIKINPNTKEYKIYKNIENDDSSISNNSIRYINEDLYGNILVGTSHGINILNLSTDKFNHYTEKDGLINNTIYGILVDKNNGIWMSTNAGISKLSTEDATFKNFTITDGLQSNEFNGRACFKSKDGNMYFGGINGFNVFNSQDIELSTFEPKVIFDNFEINGTNKKDISNIKFKSNENNIKINFFTNDYKNTKTTQYYYKLEGLENEWNMTNSNSLVFANLGSGDYTLKIKTITQHGVMSDESSVHFTINPPIWRSNYAICIYLILIIISILRYMHKVNTLDRLVNERTNKLRKEMEKNEQLFKKVLSLEQNKNNYFVNLSHELRTPLNVLSSINQLIKEFTKKDNFITPEKLSYYMGIMDRNCSRLLSLINNLIDHTKIENNSYIINKKDEDIVYLVEETVLDMKDYIEEKGLELIFDTDVEEKVIRCDKVDIERCIINLVGNAVKFTPEGGLIEVLLQDLDDKVKIIVKDNGIGISEENQKIIFDRFNQVVDESSEQKGGSGLGLTITKQLITLHNGEIYVESEVGVGSEFIIILPVYSS